jgi:PTS system fructose-specific IIC component
MGRKRGTAMHIVDLLQKESIELNASVATKDEAIDRLIALQNAGGNLSDIAEYKKGILAREALGSTAVGEGIAIPHAKSESVKRPGLAAMTVPDGVDYKSLDGKPSNLLFMIAAPNDGDVHLEVLSRLMTILMDEKFREDLLAAKSADEFLAVIDRKEKDKYPEEQAAAKPAEEKAAKTGYRVLAVTACPTGIAHTYMAAESLEKAGRKLGYSIKVETNGSGGAKNVLTDEEIAAADGIIIAADKSVEMARFDGKKLISTKVTDGIKKPEELINRIISGDAEVYHSTGEKHKASSGNESVGRKLYKHLMSGVSNMLPFVVGGGIFIAVAFLVDTLSGRAPRQEFRFLYRGRGFPEDDRRLRVQLHDTHPRGLYRQEHRRQAGPSGRLCRRLSRYDWFDLRERHRRRIFRLPRGALRGLRRRLSDARSTQASATTCRARLKGSSPSSSIRSSASE